MGTFRWNYVLKPFVLFLILDFLFCTPWTIAGGSCSRSPGWSIQAADLSVIFGQQARPPQPLQESASPISFIKKIFSEALDTLTTIPALPLIFSTVDLFISCDMRKSHCATYLTLEQLFICGNSFIVL
ncbi:hypothetical protein J1605_004503 [Eschrichtius robustus]|uniref:Uncharacterized protein n=1 Tax=Eschrichtius robustus TaxID=9764 RepID=A0AB34HIB7_ESCRO|nr:hypothetical protein J1605_004503 [Eschrichtius robustus]